MKSKRPENISASHPPAMRNPPIRKYLFNCGLLLLPLSVWNAALAGLLPPAFAAGEFWRDIPRALGVVEDALRWLIFILPFLMPLSVASPRQRAGLGLFIAGNLVYFASWLALIAAPDSLWSRSALGFLAPAYTPALWLAGLALLGRHLYWGRFYRWWMYLALSGLFLAAHLAHGAIVYARNY
jgi:hypothetical protein